jgi:hypothetical protein
VVSPREAFVAYAVAAGDGARILWRAYAVDGGLVALEVCEAGEVC